MVWRRREMSLIKERGRNFYHKISLIVCIIIIPRESWCHSCFTPWMSTTTFSAGILLKSNESFFFVSSCLHVCLFWHVWQSEKGRESFLPFACNLLSWCITFCDRECIRFAKLNERNRWCHRESFSLLIPCRVRCIIIFSGKWVE